MLADTARTLYEKITALDGFDRSLQIEPEVPQRDQLFDSIDEALRDCRTDDGRLYHTPSPWHAFFQLWERQGAARDRGSAVFFRGHNVVNLPRMTAQIYRANMSEESARQARLAVEILAHMLGKSEIVRMKEDDPIVLARTVAQHYGVPTSLIDVTLDPSVAVFFASTDGSGDAGAVFVFDWKHCEEMKLKVILPPMSPWAKRLTVQRGFFLEFEEIRSLGIEDVPFEIQFPRMPGFEVRRHGKTYVPSPVNEPAATQLIRWVKNAACNHEAMSPAITAQIEEHGETRVLLKDQFELMFGFAPGDPIPQPETRERVRKAVRQYRLDSFLALELYINYLCLTSSGWAADRVAYLRESNRSIFGLYLDALCRMRPACQLLDPQYTELLRILDYDCS